MSDETVGQQAEVAFEPNKSFDPRPYISQIKGQNYLQVAPRIAWFRSEFPEGAIEIQQLVLNEKQAVFKTRVTAVRDKVVLGYAEGIGSEFLANFGSYIEKASTKSLGRALAAMGYGTIESLEYEDGNEDLSQLADSPVGFTRQQLQPRQQAPQRPQQAPQRQQGPTHTNTQQRPQNASQGQSGGPPPSEKQWQMFNGKVQKLRLNGAVVAQQVAGVPPDKLTGGRGGSMSQCIDRLMAIENGEMEIPNGWRLDHDDGAGPSGPGGPPPNTDDMVKQNWIRNIGTAKSPEQLDTMWESIQRAGLGDDPEIVSLMGLREEELLAAQAG